MLLATVEAVEVVTLMVVVLRATVVGTGSVRTDVETAEVVDARLDVEGMAVVEARLVVAAKELATEAREERAADWEEEMAAIVCD